MSPNSAQLIADLAREAQLRQLNGIDSLDAKSSTLLGFAGVILGLVFTSSTATEHWSHGLSLGAASMVAAIMSLLLSLLPRKFKANPSPLALAARYMNQQPSDTAAAVVESINRAILFNANIQRWKIRTLQIGAFLATVGLVVMSVSLIYTVETTDLQSQRQQNSIGTNR
jgi:hypothetical protein